MTMAQTKSKSKSSGKRSQASKKAPAKKSRSSSTRSRSSSAKKSRSSSANANGRGKISPSAVTDAAGKAKIPLVAGSAALVGVAGGAALGARKARRRGGLARAAKGAGELGARVGHLATELQRNREAANGGDAHRSPVEVVLEGLTTRRR
jgi:hypothetical protein